METLYQAGDLLNQIRVLIIPLCRELPLRGSTSTVYLDILAVRASGRPVLIECKLWKNPQARREVVGQILEYGASSRSKLCGCGCSGKSDIKSDVGMDRKEQILRP